MSMYERYAYEVACYVDYVQARRWSPSQIVGLQILFQRAYDRLYVLAVRGKHI